MDQKIRILTIRSSYVGILTLLRILNFYVLTSVFFLICQYDLCSLKAF